MKERITAVSTFLCNVILWSVLLSTPGMSDEKPPAGWVQMETKRTLESLREDPNFQVYSELTRGRHAEWEKARLARERELLGRGALFYNGSIYEFHKPKRMERWIWRRTSIENYVRSKSAWEILATIDQPGETELMSHPSAVCLAHRCLVGIPHSKPSEVLWREFDLETRRFLDGGFTLQGQNVSKIVWQDRDTVVVQRDREASIFPQGEAIVQWSRGQPFSAAKVLLHARNTDESLDIESFVSSEGAPFLVVRRRSGANEVSWRRARQAGSGAPAPWEHKFWRIMPSGDLAPLEIPSDAWPIGIHSGQLILKRTVYAGRVYGRSDDWEVGGQFWDGSSILSIPLTELSDAAQSVHLVTGPYHGQSAHVHVFITRDCVAVQTSEYMRVRFRCYRFGKNRWIGSEITFPVEYATIASHLTLADPTSSTALNAYETLIQPRTLVAIDTRRGKAAALPGRSSLPFDDPSQYVMHMFEATSEDKTRVPYFVAHRRNLRLDGRNPTYIWFYGGWGVPELPEYAKYCKPGYWMQRGGICVVAGIRGGTEKGHQWYVRGPERRHTYNDVVAVAEDLISRKITSAKHLGMFGHYKYGGLAVAVVAQKRPDLFNAAVVERGILDVLDPAIRDDYELGSPEVPEDRAYLESISPLQNLQRGTRTWPILIVDAGLSQATYGYVAKSRVLQLPYYLHDWHSDPAGRTSEDTVVYTYLVGRLMQSN